MQKLDNKIHQQFETKVDRFFQGLYNPFVAYAMQREYFLDHLPNGLARMRSDSHNVCQDFSKVEDRVFCSLSSIFENARETLIDKIQGNDEELCRLIRGFRQGFCLGIWGFDKVVAVYDENEASDFASSGADWWRDYTTDWVEERFLPWSIYLSEPERDKNTLGYFVGFEVQQGSLVMCCQVLRNANDFDPYLYHEFKFTPGLTLGEIVDAYDYSNSISEDLIRIYCKQNEGIDIAQARSYFTETGQIVAGRVFPLLTAFLSEDFQRETYAADVVNNVYLKASVALEQRLLKNFNSQQVRELMEGREGKIFAISLPRVKTMMS